MPPYGTACHDNKKEGIPLWTITEGQDVRIDPKLIPEHVWKYLARDTLEAAKRFYADPKNREKYEKWKAEQDAAKKVID